MATDTAIERVKDDLHQAMDRMRVDLTRVEILTAALSAFSHPIPDYEPAFRHIPRVNLGAHEMGREKLD